MEHNSVVMTRVKQYLTVIIRKSSGIISTTSKHPFYQTISFKGPIESIYIKLKMGWSSSKIKFFELSMDSSHLSDAFSCFKNVGIILTKFIAHCFKAKKETLAKE